MTVLQHKQFIAAAFILTFLTPIIYPSLESQSLLNQAASRGIDSEVSMWSAKLKSSDEEERREAVMNLSALESALATAALAGALNDRSPRVRAAAAAALAQRTDQALAASLAARLNVEKEAFVRKALAYALAGFRGPERNAALIRALKDKDPEVRGAAAVALEDRPASDTVPALILALSDKNAFVRAHAAAALGINGSAASVALSGLIKLLEGDEDGEARRQGATALGRIGDRAALPALERAKLDKDPYLAQAAVDAINAIRRKE